MIIIISASRIGTEPVVKIPTKAVQNTNATIGLPTSKAENKPDKDLEQKAQPK